MRKYFLLSAVAFVALAIVVFGAWSKSTRQSYADAAMQAGKVSQLIGMVALTILLVMWLRKKS